MPTLINQGEETDEFNVTYERLRNAETGKEYRAYSWEYLQLRRAHIAGLAMPGQQPEHTVLEEPAIAEAAAR